MGLRPGLRPLAGSRLSPWDIFINFREPKALAGESRKTRDSALRATLGLPGGLNPGHKFILPLNSKIDVIERTAEKSPVRVVTRRHHRHRF
jgi:hypothetical protein